MKIIKEFYKAVSYLKTIISQNEEIIKLKKEHINSHRRAMGEGPKYRDVW